MTDRELLLYLARQVEDLTEEVRKRLDHQDQLEHATNQMVAGVSQTLDHYRPLLDQAQRRADTLGKVQGFLGGKRT